MNHYNSLLVGSKINKLTVVTLTFILWFETGMVRDHDKKLLDEWVLAF